MFPSIIFFNSGNFFYRKSAIGQLVVMATIEANNGAYCLQKRIEKFPLLIFLLVQPITTIYCKGNVLDYWSNFRTCYWHEWPYTRTIIQNGEHPIHADLLVLMGTIGCLSISDLMRHRITEKLKMQCDIIYHVKILFTWGHESLSTISNHSCYHRHALQW